MSGVNPLNLANWNLGGLTWNAWGEPNEVIPQDAPQAPNAPAPPPPRQSSDTVSIGSTPASSVSSYQPPRDWNLGSLTDALGPTLNDEIIGEIDLQSPAFWLGDSDKFPEGRHRDLTEEQATAIDFDTYNNSLAKALGVSWPKYQVEVEGAREEFQNSNVQAHHQGGSYSFSLDPSARVSSQYANPSNQYQEDRRTAEQFSQQLNDLRKYSNSDFLKLVKEIEGNGYRLEAHKLGPAYDSNPNDGVTEVKQRVYYTLNGRVIPGLGDADGPNLTGGVDGLQNAGWFGQNSTVGSSPRSGVISGGSSSDPANRLQIAERLAMSFASAIGSKGAREGGSNTEAGAAVFEEGEKIVLYWLSAGSQDTVPATGFAKGLMQANQNRKLLWVIHNHPNGSEFSTDDILNGKALAFATSPQLDRFQGLLLGKPGGNVSVFPAERLRDN